MTFTLNDEQRMLKDAARDFFREQAPVTRLRKQRDEKKNGRDPDLWREMAAMGWAGVIIPEEFGGVGLGYVALGAVLEEGGRTLVASPLHSSALAGASALLLAGTDAQKQEWLPKIAAGEVTATIAIDEGAHHAPTKSKMKFDGGKLTGEKKYVADGHIADLIIVAGADALYLVKSDAAGLTRRELITADSRGAADLKFEGVAAQKMNGGADVIDAILDRARIGLAAEMVGQASEAFEITSEYLKTRRQFGQVIGGFQALQHRAAKLFTDLELTRSCVLAALDALDRNSNNIAEYASLAKARASETVHLASNEMVQLHGGIGMTDEHDAGLYLKRARVAEALYGGASFHRDRYASLLGF
ncbi:acyl-CoA dehydrogenase family protein [Candidatus Viadribacter manganicus]|uniref:Acyl-CoA dehydrogenase n=1 Tax=Candidatus Viadribacter manganicus TaxID=1759059 RepID=A0A1B1AFC1_9PROT|nr:acyl-CoA dehydrogenase family protein [Candidatus Viadribacter manganicus]ANP45263.1 acyl-CoA dehydrogenase [Candidatus Viadribacter manganicus]